MNKQPNQPSGRLTDDQLLQIGNRIYTLRKDAHQTQEELANELGFSQANTISKLENGQGITLDKIIQIANYYHVSYERLIDGTGHSYVLDILTKYINFESFHYSNPDIDSNTHTLPIIEINTKLYETLKKIALAQSIKDLPSKLKEEWINQIKEEFMNPSIETEKTDCSSFIIVDKSILEKDDCPNNNIILNLIEACESSSNQTNLLYALIFLSRNCFLDI